MYFPVFGGSYLLKELLSYSGMVLHFMTGLTPVIYISLNFTSGSNYRVKVRFSDCLTGSQYDGTPIPILDVGSSPV